MKKKRHAQVSQRANPPRRRATVVSGAEQRIYIAATWRALRNAASLVLQHADYTKHPDGHATTCPRSDVTACTCGLPALARALNAVDPTHRRTPAAAAVAPPRKRASVNERLAEIYDAVVDAARDVAEKTAFGRDKHSLACNQHRRDDICMCGLPVLVAALKELDDWPDEVPGDKALRGMLPDNSPEALEAAYRAVALTEIREALERLDHRSRANADEPRIVHVAGLAQRRP